MKNVKSEYAINENVRLSKKVLSYTLDFFVCIIVSSFLFLIINMIGGTTSYVKKATYDVSVENSSLYDLVFESKLDVKSSTGGLSGNQTITKNYMLSLVYESLKTNKVENITNSKYTNVSPISPSSDSCYYYFVVYKDEKKNDFKDLSKDGSYYLSKLNESSYFEYRESNYPYLKVEFAKEIDEYFSNASYSKGLQTYNNIYNLYSSLLEEGVIDFTNNNVNFIKVNSRYTTLKDYILSIKVTELFISYVLSSLICFLLIPMLLKNGRTFSFWCLGLICCTKQGTNLRWFNYLINFILLFISYLGSISILSFVIYSYDAIYLFTSNVFGFINLLTFLIFSLIFIILSLLVSFFTKDKSFLNELASSILVKDTKYFKVENKEDNNGK